MMQKHSIQELTLLLHSRPLQDRNCDSLVSEPIGEYIFLGMSQLQEVRLNDPSDFNSIKSTRSYFLPFADVVCLDPSIFRLGNQVTALQSAQSHRKNDR